MEQNLSPDKQESLLHWAQFGAHGEPSNRRIQRTDFREVSDILIPVVSTWDVSVPRAELSKLINGFLPTSMDNKWFVYADGPDARGNAVVYLVRSWTAYKLVELKVKVPVGEDGKLVEEDSKITEITWESSQERYKGRTEEAAKKMAREVCNWVLEVNLG